MRAGAVEPDLWWFSEHGHGTQVSMAPRPNMNKMDVASQCEAVLRAGSTGGLGVLMKH